MHEAIRQMLKEYDCDSAENTVHALREIFQEIILLGLWRSKFFEHAAFYGGTALRILYGLNRYSEDLDFSLFSPDTDFSLHRYMAAVEKELLAFGFTVTAEVREKKADSPIQSAFLKTDTTRALLVISAKEAITDSIHPGRLLKIKLEIDTDPPPGFHVEAKYLLQPIPFAVRTYTLPDLFAGKIHALLCRKWKTRVKGRDWYDLVWYLAHNPHVHLSHLEQRMRQSGHWQSEGQLTEKNLHKLLEQAVDHLDINQAKKDILPFVKDSRSIEIWTKEFFTSILSRIQV